MVSEGTGNQSASRSSAQFATTHWSTVLAAGQDESARAAQALERSCRSYWCPLSAYVRSSGHTPADAEDLTQEFFAHLIAKHYLSAVHRERGRFRWFLLSAVKRFRLNERERAAAAKRGRFRNCLLACLKHFLSEQWRRAGRLKREGGRTCRRCAGCRVRWSRARTPHRWPMAVALTLSG